MKSRYVMFAGYNQWANALVYDAAEKLSDADYRADRGAFFKSVHGTLNHMLLADRVWMRRFTGHGEHPPNLDAILYDDFAALRVARHAEDRRIIDYIEGLSEADLAGKLTYRTITNPATVQQDLTPALDHFFNHQAHHRGQLHGLITALAGKAAGPVLDLLAYQRERGIGAARKLD